MKTLTFLILLLAAGIPSLMAQQAEPSPTPENSKSVSYLRVWVMIPPDVPPKIVGESPTLAENLSMVYRNDAEQEQTIIGHATPFSACGYIEMSPLKCNIRLIYKTAGPPIELTNLKATLKGGLFYTIIVQKQNDRYQMTLVDDTEPPLPAQPDATPPPRGIVLYNFVPGSTMTVSCKAPSFSRSVAYGKPERITGFPAKIINLEMPMKKLKGSKREYVGIFEANFQTNNQLSFIVAKDIYDRVAPFITVDGKTE